MESQRLRLNLGQEQSKLRGKDEEIYELKQRLLRLESQGDSKLSDLNARLRDYEVLRKGMLEPTQHAEERAEREAARVRRVGAEVPRDGKHGVH